MKRIPREHFEQLCATGQVLARDAEFVRAVRAPDGSIWKCFRKKPFPSSASIRPYAKRFIRSARKLTERNIPTVRVRDHYIIEGENRHVVVYDELPGTILRDALAAAADTPKRFECLMTAFAAFVAELHGRGIYFRSMHFGNVLVLPETSPQNEHTFGLIDVTETHFSPLSLTMWRRARNFKPVTSYESDRNAIIHFGGERFLSAYLDAAHLPARKHKVFLNHIRRLNPCLAVAAGQLT